MSEPSPYVALYLTRMQVEQLRKLVAREAESTGKAHWTRRLLKRIDEGLARNA